ncbi:MAG: serB [Solimicrobium sp.]|jgi:phosphoserine phosphatase|nr:serB [Solimicrobium sp.]
MNLILQSDIADMAVLRHLASLVVPKQIIELSPCCVHCVGIAFTKDLAINQTQFDQLAYQEQVDIYWSESERKLTDFKLLVMDMDSTLITIECIDEIADMQGLKSEVSVITEAAMRGEIAFAESLTRRVALLKGLPAAALQRVYDERVRLSSGAEKLLHAVQSAGLKTLLVSGGFTYFTDRLKARLSLDYGHSNQLEVIDEKLTGSVVGNIVDAEEKCRTVKHICAKLAIPPAQAIIIGDGANDLAMMKIAGLSVAFRAKPLVRIKADVALNFTGLDGLLNLL